MIPKIGVVIPHSHTWFNTQTCVSKIIQHTPKCGGYELDIAIVDNSWEWSPAIRGITDTRLGECVRIINNDAYYYIRAHGSALDLAFASLDTDLILTIETDAMPLRDGWLHCFLAFLDDSDYACGGWHHQNFANPSFTLYRRRAWERMKKEFCDSFPTPKTHAYWGPGFNNIGVIIQKEVDTIGPFSERRGWPPGTIMKSYPHMMNLGPYHYEPGQAFYHWAIEFGGYTFSRVPYHDTWLNGIPTGTYYGWTEGKDIHQAVACHYWGGTRALDPIKHSSFPRFFNDPSLVSFKDDAITQYRPYWLKRESDHWLRYVDESIRIETLSLIQKYGWINGAPTEVEKSAIDPIVSVYKSCGIAL